METDFAKRSHARGAPVQGFRFKVQSFRILPNEATPRGAKECLWEKGGKGAIHEQPTILPNEPIRLSRRIHARRTEVRASMKITKRTHRSARSSKFRVQGSTFSKITKRSQGVVFGVFYTHPAQKLAGSARRVPDFYETNPFQGMATGSGIGNLPNEANPKPETPNSELLRKIRNEAILSSLSVFNPWLRENYETNPFPRTAHASFLPNRRDSAVDASTSFVTVAPHFLQLTEETTQNLCPKHRNTYIHGVTKRPTAMAR